MSFTTTGCWVQLCASFILVSNHVYLETRWLGWNSYSISRKVFLMATILSMYVIASCALVDVRLLCFKMNQVLQLMTK